MGWYDEPGQGDDGDILTIEVFGSSNGGGFDTGGVDIALKAAADCARWTLKGGGALLVVIGGVAMVIGGYTAWTGGGAGIFVGGAAGFVVGAGAFWLGSQLDQIVRDPPQPDFRKPVHLIPARLRVADQSDPLAPVHRAVAHLSHLSVLAPNLLDALERQGGARAAGDDPWTAAWTGALDTLHGLTLARIAGLSQALTALADSQMPDTMLTGAEMSAGLEALQGKKGKAAIAKLIRDWGLQPEVMAAATDWIASVKPADVALPTNPAEVLRRMARQLDRTAAGGLAAY
jgi:hypothetical protein